MGTLYEKTRALFELQPSPGHDFKHALRVANLAKYIAKQEGYDEREAETAGLLHDIGRTIKDTENIGHAKIALLLIRELLDNYTDFEAGTKNGIIDAIAQHSDNSSVGALSHILQDADKLDGLGAIGISRAYISNYEKPDYNPDDIIPLPGEYAKPKTIHHQIMFQARWINMMYTVTGKRLAQKRFQFMQSYMEEIKREIEESS